MLLLYRIIWGEVVIKIYGTAPERLLNTAAENRLGFRGVRVNREGIYAVMPVNKFFRLRQYVRKTGIKIHIVGKKGLRFFLKRYNARAGFFLGLLLFAAVLKFLSGFVWTVEVSGNNLVKSSDILNACRALGVYEGVSAKSIDTTNGPQEMLIRIPQLAWASFNIENCVLTVNVTEVRKNEREKSEYPSNLRAVSDGVITKIDVYSGNVVVKIGDTVSKGDLLVSGVLESSDSSIFVRSKGSVTARTEKTVTVGGNFLQTVKTPLNKTEKKTVLEFFSLKIPLYIGETEPPYNTRSFHKRAKIFGKLLPFSFTTRKFELLREQNIEYSYEELEAILKKKIEEKTEKMCPDGAEIRFEGIKETENGLTLERIVSVNEKISSEDLILFDTIN